MPTVPCFVSLVDEANKPLFVYVPPNETEDVNKVLKYNVLSNISLDYFENQLFEWISLESQPDIKFLFILEGVGVYGMLIKQTGLKIIIGFPALHDVNTLDDTEIDKVFSKVKKMYLRAKLNPFVTSCSDDSKEWVVNLKQKLAEEFC